MVRVYLTKKEWLKGRLGLGWGGDSIPTLVGAAWSKSSIALLRFPLCQMGLLLCSGTTGMGAGQEPVARGRLSDLAAPDICAYAGNKKGHWCRWLFDVETETNWDHLLLCRNKSNWTKSRACLFLTGLICEQESWFSGGVRISTSH